MTGGRPRIGVTQRRVVLPERAEVRDALDVRLPRMLALLGFHPVPIPTLDDGLAEHLVASGFSGLVLSGGDDPGDAPERDAVEAAVLDHAEARGLPVLGICRGLQVLALRAGGTVVQIEGHVATRHAVRGPWAGDRADVNSFHRAGLVSERLGRLEPMATAPDGTVEAAVHPDLPWAGVMWHPEREPVLGRADVELVTAVLRGDRPVGTA